MSPLRRRPWRLSAHFLLQEFSCSDGTPVPDRAISALAQLAQLYLEPLRLEHGPVTITSGYRTRQVNEANGGAPFSYHRYDLTGRRGVAADVTCARGTPRQWYSTLALLSPGGLGGYGTFVHVDNRAGARARW